MTRVEALRARNEVGYGMQVMRNKVDDIDVRSRWQDDVIHERGYKTETCFAHAAMFFLSSGWILTS